MKVTGNFVPDYNNILQAALNETPARTPLYEHIISERIMEDILGTSFAELVRGDERDKREYIIEEGRDKRE